MLDQLEAVDAGHDQVLQDHGRLQAAARLRRAWVASVHVVELDVGLVGEHAAHRLDR